MDKEKELTLFRTFARLYHEKYGRIPQISDKYDKANFKVFLMGWDVRRRRKIMTKGELIKALQDLDNISDDTEVRCFCVDTDQSYQLDTVYFYAGTETVDIDCYSPEFQQKIERANSKK